MRRVSNGYTIVEVVIFLTISLVIAAASWSLISGKQEETDFNQKMRDTQSQMQDWINDVSNGFSGANPTSQKCAAASQGGKLRPQIQPGAPGSGYTPTCTFLGKAIQFYDDPTGANAQSSTLYTYPVFGCRLSGLGGCDSNGTTPASMYDAYAEPALSLTQSFDLGPAYVSEVCSLTQDQAQSHAACMTSDSSHLIGFMNSFNTQQNAQVNGAEDVNAYIYNYKLDTGQGSSGIVSCIEGAVGSPCQLYASPPSKTNPPGLSEFWFCLTDGKHTAQITITSSSGIGATVSLDYKQVCSS